MVRWLTTCAERLCGSCAQIICPPVIICFLGGSYLFQFILAKLDTMLVDLLVVAWLLGCLVAWLPSCLVGWLVG
ncbi:hypothetical protein AK812_SmicGene18313 [Symbiodinium microadriaticum]|uniref:Uncharacterized protein n=1 Tax=Symbiodinium microadriaticum TaxID=2951 RepID=A0A1Q9DVF5_SYMMI|nr:hypothetical protein AK812_SmicGene18313 [Symbiodinium microadriaticum]